MNKTQPPTNYGPVLEALNTYLGTQFTEANIARIADGRPGRAGSEFDAILLPEQGPGSDTARSWEDGPSDARLLKDAAYTSGLRNEVCTAYIDEGTPRAVWNEELQDLQDDLDNRIPYGRAINLPYIAQNLRQFITGANIEVLFERRGTLYNSHDPAAAEAVALVHALDSILGRHGCETVPLSEGDRAVRIRPSAAGAVTPRVVLPELKQALGRLGRSAKIDSQAGCLSIEVDVLRRGRKQLGQLVELAEIGDRHTRLAAELGVETNGRGMAPRGR